MADCALLSLAWTAPALATGTVACVVEDRVLSLSLNAPFGTEQSDTLLNVTGKVAIKYEGIPRETGDLALDRAAVAQYRFAGPDLKLKIYRDTQHGDSLMTFDIALILRQVRTDPTTYRGRYILNEAHRDAKKPGPDRINKASGYAECSAD